MQAGMLVRKLYVLLNLCCSFSQLFVQQPIGLPCSDLRCERTILGQTRTPSLQPALCLLAVLMSSQQSDVHAAAAGAWQDLARGRTRKASRQQMVHLHLSRRCASAAALLGSDQPAVQEQAACALCEILQLDRSQTRMPYIAADALPLLVAVLGSDQLAVLVALSDLAEGCQQNRDAIIAAGAVPLLVALLRSEQPAMQAVSAGVLWVLTLGPQHNQDAIIAAGAVPLIVALLKCDQSAVQTTAAGALACLASGSQQNQEVTMAADAAPQLVALWRSDQPAVQAQAAATLLQLAVRPQVNLDATIDLLQLAHNIREMPSLQQALCLCLLPC